MDTVLSILHVVGAIFIVGPMAILPMTAMRAARAGQRGQVATIAKSTAIFSYISIVVAVFGFGLVSMADPKYNLTFTTPWVLASIILYAVAVVLTLAVVVPALKRAAGEDAAGSSYRSIAIGSGISSLLLVAVAVLMVWKP